MKGAIVSARNHLTLEDVDVFVDEVLKEHLPLEEAARGDDSESRGLIQTRIALRKWAEAKQQHVATVAVAKANHPAELEAFVADVMHAGGKPADPVLRELQTERPVEMARWRSLLLKIQKGTATHQDNIEIEKLSAMLFPEDHAASLEEEEEAVVTPQLSSSAPDSDLSSIVAAVESPSRGQFTSNLPVACASWVCFDPLRVMIALAETSGRSKPDADSAEGISAALEAEIRMMVSLRLLLSFPLKLVEKWTMCPWFGMRSVRDSSHRISTPAASCCVSCRTL